MSWMLATSLLASMVIFLGCVNVLFLSGPPRRRPSRFVAYELHRVGYVGLGTASAAVLLGAFEPPGTAFHFHDPQWQMLLMEVAIAAVFIGRALRTIFGPLIGICIQR